MGSKKEGAGRINAESGGRGREWRAGWWGQVVVEGTELQGACRQGEGMCEGRREPHTRQNTISSISQSTGARESGRQAGR